MFDYDVINPKKTIWKHENNIAHGSRSASFKTNNYNKIKELREPLKNSSTNITFGGSAFLGGQKLLKAIAKEFSPIQKKSSLEAYNQIKEYLDEPLKLAFEKAIKSYDDKAPDIVVFKPICQRFVEAVAAPFNAIVNGCNRLISSPQARQAIADKKKTGHIIANLESVYQEITKLADTPSGEIKKVIADSLSKKLNATRSNYSINVASTVVRVIAGVLGAVFVANDFSNLKRLSNDDPKEAKKEWKSKFKQVLTGIGISAYLGYLTNTTFKKTVNSNLKFAVGLNLVNLVFTEIVSRKLTGRPILPVRNNVKSDKALNGKTELAITDRVPALFGTASQVQQKQNQPASSHASKDRKSSSNISFTGGPLMQTISRMPRDKFVNLMKILEKVDKGQYDKVVTTVQKGLEKLGEFKGKEISQIIEKNAFPEIKKIPIGRNNLYNYAARMFESLVMPVKLLVKLANKLVGRNAAKISSKVDQVQDLSPTFVKNTLGIIEKAKAGLGNVSDKELLEKLNSNSGLASKFKEVYGEFLTDLLGAQKAKYDASKASTFFKLTGAAIIPFLVMDAYNVSKKETGDEDLAMQKAKERIGQDVTRQAFSTWIVAAFNNIFKEIYNKSLLGLSLVTTANVLVNETLTRLSTGNAILPKTKAELEELDTKNFNRKGLSASYFRLMSRLTGRKPLSEQRIGKRNKAFEDTFYNDVLAYKSNNSTPQFSRKSNIIHIDNSVVPERFRS